MASDTTDLRFFVTLAESGTLSEAARRMDVTASAISQRLQQLEKRLNVHLIHRSTRRFNTFCALILNSVKPERKRMKKAALAEACSLNRRKTRTIMPESQIDV